MEKLKMHSPDLSQDNIAKIRELFPGCVTEARDEITGKLRLAVDFDQLRQELSDSIVEGSQERYRLDWPGKREALFSANAPIAKTLRPLSEKSVGFDVTKNIFIEGDNLDALKILQTHYLGKVKMIYIDPPYNTGNDFIYADNFTETSEDFLIKSQQIDTMQNRLVSNKDSNGRFHSDWMSMMYQRLRVSKNLLRDDGVIVISIDENEQANLTKMMDEIYGSENHIGTFVWKTRQASGKQVSANNISIEHEYIIAYSKTDLAKFSGVDRDKSTYTNPDNDPRGDWAKHPLDVGSTKEERPNCFYDLVDPNTGITYKANPNRVWAFSKESMAKLVAEGKVIFSKDGSSRPGLKKFFAELKSEKKPISTWLDREKFSLGYNTEGTKKANALFDEEKVFDYPKPLSLIRLLIGQIMKEGDLVMDFFAGSGTTAHALFDWSAKQGVNARFVCVQLQEPVIQKSIAYQSGYRNISELAIERIRRAGQKILEGDCHPDWNRDVGFRVLKVDSSNMKDIYYRPDKLSQGDLLEAVDNVKPDRTPEDLLFQVLVDWGVDLTLPIRRESLQGKTVFFVDDNALVACFDTGITEELVKELAKHEPLRVVFRDNGFVSDALKINVEQIFRQLSPSTEVRSL